MTIRRYRIVAKGSRYRPVDPDAAGVLAQTFSLGSKDDAKDVRNSAAIYTLGPS